MDMDSEASPYYPPRARWYSSLWQLWYTLKRWLHLDRLPAAVGQVPHVSLLGIVLPGWALLWSRRPIFGVILGSAYCLSAAVFLIWVGYPVSTFAFTVMISIHAGSIMGIEASVGLWKRMLYSVLIFLTVAECVYLPLRDHWFRPLLFKGRVIVVHAGRPSGPVKRGDWIAYRLPQFYRAGVRLAGGDCTLGRVLAVAGDEVTFRPDSVLINGEPCPRLAYMPTKGSIRVEQKCWFIWPEMVIEGNGAAGTVEQAMMQLAIVPGANCVGVLYQRWFWRRQSLP